MKMIMAGHSSKLLVLFLVLLVGLSSGAFAVIPLGIWLRIGRINSKGSWLGITVPTVDAMNEIFNHIDGPIYPDIEFAGNSRKLLLSLLVFLVALSTGAFASIPPYILAEIDDINSKGPYLGITVPNAYAMNHLLNSSSFHPNETYPYLDFAAKRFRLGRVGNESVIVVMTGHGMLNAGITTQLLLLLFKVKGVVQFGVAGNAHPGLLIGDVTIPQYWAHSGLWYWQRYGEGAEDELASNYTKEIGFLNISDYNVDKNTENLLNYVWYQPEEIFPVNGTPEVGQKIFWVPVNETYYALAQRVEGMKVDQCVNSTTCLPRAPLVIRVQRGTSSDIYVDNRDYRIFLASEFDAIPIDMDSAAVALVCRQQNVPFIAIKGLSSLAGGGSSLPNEETFSPLATQNAVLVLVAFIGLLSS